MFRPPSPAGRDDAGGVSCSAGKEALRFTVVPGESGNEVDTRVQNPLCWLRSIVSRLELVLLQLVPAP
jgi:hypothetical protein